MFNITDTIIEIIGSKMGVFSTSLIFINAMLLYTQQLMTRFQYQLSLLV